MTIVRTSVYTAKVKIICEKSDPCVDTRGCPWLQVSGLTRINCTVPPRGFSVTAPNCLRRFFGLNPFGTWTSQQGWIFPSCLFFYHDLRFFKALRCLTIVKSVSFAVRRMNNPPGLNIPSAILISFSQEKNLHHFGPGLGVPYNIYSI